MDGDKALVESTVHFPSFLPSGIGLNHLCIETDRKREINCVFSSTPAIETIEAVVLRFYFLCRGDGRIGLRRPHMVLRRAAIEMRAVGAHTVGCNVSPRRSGYPCKSLRSVGNQKTQSREHERDIGG